MLSLLCLAQDDSLITKVERFGPPLLVHSQVGHSAEIVDFVEPRDKCPGVEPSYLAEDVLRRSEILKGSIATPHSGEGPWQEHRLCLHVQAPYKLHGHLRDSHPGLGLLVGYGIPGLDEVTDEFRIPVLGIIENDLGILEKIKLCE